MLRWMICGGVVLALVAEPATREAEKAPLEWVNPANFEAGKIVAFPQAAHQPTAGTKVVYDATKCPKDKPVAPVLERMARLVNLAQVAHVEPKKLQLAVVFSGEATVVCLRDEAFAGGKNPHLPILQQLKRFGVQFYICGQALSERNYRPADVHPDVILAASAMTTLINEQSQGAAYLTDR